MPPNTTARIDLPSGVQHDVGSGQYRWRDQSPVTNSAPRKPLGLTSSVSDVIDDPRAYSAVTAAIAEIDPDRAEVFRRSTRWRAGRALEEQLNKAPVPVLRAVERALTELSA